MESKYRRFMGKPTVLDRTGPLDLYERFKSSKVKSEPEERKRHYTSATPLKRRFMEEMHSGDKPADELEKEFVRKLMNRQWKKVSAEKKVRDWEKDYEEDNSGYLDLEEDD